MAQAWQHGVFWALAITMTLTAVRVVTASNVVHAALYLVATLMGAAAVYILLLAEFVAWVQVLIYVGAIVVLMLFGLMLTRAPIGRGGYDNDQRLIAAVTAGVLFAVTAWVSTRAFAGRRIPLATAAGTSTRREVVSVVLLAALVGAIVIARRD
jgi:NADH-quinone oxidoreductase subunit J